MERVARRAGVVARPSADRWHRKTIPLLGGVAIVTATLGPMLVTAGGDNRVLILAITSLAMAALGFVDDLRDLRPQVKLLGQIVLAAALLHLGFELRLTGYRLADVVVTLFWVVAITNAFNLLDNMDGLAATIALVATAFRLLFFVWEGDPLGARICAVFLGAIAGFLIRNFAPAKIFMGDTGSLFLGFFVAGLSLVPTDRAYSRGVVAVLVVPVFLLLIPIFDTMFVTVTRVLAGRSPAVGGRDHTSHRLVDVGLSERETVMLLAAVSIGGGGVAVLSYRVGFAQAVVAAALLVVTLVLLGIHLNRIHVVRTGSDPSRAAVLRLLADFQYKRQVATLVLDVCLIVLAFYAAYVIRFEHDFPHYVDQLYQSLPVVLLSQLIAFAAFGLYRGIWRYTGVSDGVRIVKAATIGTMVPLIVLLYTYRFVGFSRTVFVLDWLMLIAMVGASRLSFRLFAEVLRRKPEAFRRVLIYGAGGGGELAVREMLNNPELELIPIGFIDDDRSKHQTRLHGLPVFGGVDQLDTVLRERNVQELIVSSTKVTGPALEHALELCGQLDVLVRRASIRFD